MPQTFQVLRCYSCFVFQIHPTKKSNKFECKVCGEKQSIKRHYGLGTGKECRIHVQKLNGIRGSMSETSSQDDIDIDEFEHTNENLGVIDNQSKNESKWLEYVDKNEVDSNVPVPNDSMYLGDAEVVLDIPKKRRKYSSNKNFKTNKDTVEANDLYDNISKPYGKTSFEVQENLEDNSHTSQLKTASDRLKKNTKQFLPPAFNKSSKWAQYTETTKDDIGNEKISNDLNRKGELKDFNNSYNYRNDKFAAKKLENTKTAPEEHSLQSLNEERKLPIKFNKPLVHKLSKWASYSDDGDIKQDLDLQNKPQSHHQSKFFNSSNPQKLFSLCDDSDLDNVLDI